MPLNLKNSQVERLVEEVAAITGESKTEAVRKALEERKERLALRLVHRDRKGEVLRFLQTEIWSKIPSDLLGQGISKAEQEEILGYGSEGS